MTGGGWGDRMRGPSCSRCAHLLPQPLALRRHGCNSCCLARWVRSGCVGAWVSLEAACTQRLHVCTAGAMVGDQPRCTQVESEGVLAGTRPPTQTELFTASQWLARQERDGCSGPSFAHVLFLAHMSPRRHCHEALIALLFLPPARAAPLGHKRTARVVNWHSSRGGAGGQAKAQAQHHCDCEAPTLLRTRPVLHRAGPGLFCTISVSFGLHIEPAPPCEFLFPCAAALASSPLAPPCTAAPEGFHCYHA